MAAGVVARPQVAQRVLPAHVPDFEIHVRERHGGDILPDRRDGFADGDGVGGWWEVEGFDGGEKGGFSGVVET